MKRSHGHEHWGRRAALAGTLLTSAEVQAVATRTSIANDLRVFVCHVDANDEITFVNDAWCEFAAENGAPELTRDRAIGISLWKLITGQEARHLMEILFFRVRALELTLQFPFRCDSPSMRRNMSSTVRLLNSAGVVEIRTRTVDQHPLPSEPPPPAGMVPPRVVTVCGWCRKILVPGTGWVEVEQALVDLNLFGETRVPLLTHGMCTACEASLLQDIQALPGVPDNS